MEDCELCGNATGSVFVVNVEGVELRVCPKCAKGKRVIHREEPKRPVAKRADAAKPRKARPEEAEIVENYGTVVREAREAMQLPLTVFAEMINEKRTLLLRVEQQRTKPSIELTRKLEKALKIKLEQPPEDADKKHFPAGRSGSATLGEFAE